MADGPSPTLEPIDHQLESLSSHVRGLVVAVHAVPVQGDSSIVLQRQTSVGDRRLQQIGLATALDFSNAVGPGIIDTPMTREAL